MFLQRICMCSLSNGWWRKNSLRATITLHDIVFTWQMLLSNAIYSESIQPLLEPELQAIIQRPFARSTMPNFKFMPKLNHSGNINILSVQLLQDIWEVLQCTLSSIWQHVITTVSSDGTAQPTEGHGRMDSWLGTFCIPYSVPLLFPNGTSPHCSLHSEAYCYILREKLSAYLWLGSKLQGRLEGDSSGLYSPLLFFLFQLSVSSTLCSFPSLSLSVSVFFPCM